MKVLLTTHVFLPDYASGTEILTLNTARELQRLSHEVEICTGYLRRPGQPDPQTSHGFDRYVYAGIAVNRFFSYGAPLGGQSTAVEAEYNNFLFARWFRDYLIHYQPDVVHFFHLWLLSASAIDVCHELGIPMVMTPTDFWLICPNNQLRLPGNGLCAGPDSNSVNCLKHAVANSQHRWVGQIFGCLPDTLVDTMARVLEFRYFHSSRTASMVRALRQRAGFLRQRMNMLDRMLVPTRLMEKMLVRNGLQSEMIVFCRFGIAPLKQVPRRPDVAGQLRIGFIGGLSEHKGAHLLIAAVRSLPAAIKLTLSIYGRSSDHTKYFEKLQHLADGDDRIQFRGTFPNEIIADIFSTIDVLVVPSIWYENTPLVIYSAQAAGCPVIASDLGGMSEVVEHEVNGLLFKPGDVAGLAKAILRLADSPELLGRLAANAIRPKLAAEYAMEILDIYAKVLRERGRQ